MIDDLLPYPNWVVRRADKIPLNPRTLERAKSNDASTWGCYEEARLACERDPSLGLGFQLSGSPFSCIDLDATDNPSILQAQRQIYEGFQSYAERSPSGKGCHVWCRGKVETRKLDKIEVYSENHYITLTGDAVRAMPVADCQTELEALVQEIDRIRQPVLQTEVESAPQVCEDDSLLEKLRSHALWADYEKSDTHPSQSEADQALMNVIASRTDNKEQAVRLFRASPLGQRSKARRDDYMASTAAKAFDCKLAPRMLTPEDRELPETEPEPQIPAVDWTFPPGLIGQIAQFIYDYAYTPSKEVAIAGSLAFLAGIAGRVYNTHTGTGLNLYIVLLAHTGAGKEAAGKGITRLVRAVREGQPQIDQFVGPSSIASRQALMKQFVDTPCFLSRIPEAGIWLQRFESKYVSANDQGIKLALLDLYNKSGSSDDSGSTIYSDKSKNAASVESPTLTLLGESTPQEFYRAIDEQSVHDGLVGRLSVIEMPKQFPTFNDEASKATPAPGMVVQLQTLVRAATERRSSRDTRIVHATPEAQRFAMAFRDYAAEKTYEEGQFSEMWNRAHMKLLRIGALLAIGRNLQTPVVQVEDYQWAYKLVVHGIEAISARFETGDVGRVSASDNAVPCLLRALRVYTQYKTVPTGYKVPNHMHEYGIVPRRYLRSSSNQYAWYKNAHDPSTALNNAIESLIKEGVLTRTTKNGIGEMMNGEAYVIGMDCL